nr:hypothetical protein [Tanacetum cinerariifolium]
EPKEEEEENEAMEDDDEDDAEVINPYEKADPHNRPLISVKENQEKDKIGSKPDKNGKRGEAEKSQKQLQ